MKLEEGEEIVTTTRIRKKRPPRRKKDPIDDLLRIAAALFLIWLIYSLATGRIH